MNQVTAVLRRATGHLVVTLLALMVINVTWQIASRYLLGSPSPYTEEIARFLLVWLGLFGGAYATAFDDHIALDLIPFSVRTRRAIRAAAMSALGLVLMLGGAWLVRFTFDLEQRSPALGLPLYCVYLAAPLSGLLIILFALGAKGEESASPEATQ